jgi:hypothetical protein
MEMNCLFRMADGRNFTDYKSRYFDVSKTMDNHDYRMYMVQNADAMMEHDRKQTVKNTVCTSCETTALPERYLVTCDGAKCSSTEVSSDGLGTGRNTMNVEHSKQQQLIMSPAFYPINGIGDKFAAVIPL